MAGLHYAQRLELESNASSRTLTSSPLVLKTPALRHRKATGLSIVHFPTVGATAVAVLFLVVVCIRRILARPVDGYSRRRLAGSAGGDGPPRDGNDENPNYNCNLLGKGEDVAEGEQSRTPDATPEGRQGPAEATPLQSADESPGESPEQPDGGSGPGVAERTQWMPMQDGGEGGQVKAPQPSDESPHDQRSSPKRPAVVPKSHGAEEDGPPPAKKRRPSPVPRDAAQPLSAQVPPTKAKTPAGRPGLTWEIRQRFTVLPRIRGPPPPTLPGRGPLVVESDRGTPVQQSPEEGAHLRAQQQLASFQQHVQKLCSLINDAKNGLYLELDAEDANVEPHYAFLGILWQALNSQLQLAQIAFPHVGPFLSNQGILAWTDSMNQGLQTASEALSTLETFALADSQVPPKPLDPSEGIPQSIELLLRLDAATQALRAAMQTNRDASSPTSAAALALAVADARELLLSVNEHFDLGSLGVSTVAGQHVVHAATILGCLQREAQASMASAVLAESPEASSTAEPGRSSAAGRAPGGAAGVDAGKPGRASDSGHPPGRVAKIVANAKRATTHVTALVSSVLEDPRPDILDILQSAVELLHRFMIRLHKIHGEKTTSEEERAMILEAGYEANDASEVGEEVLRQYGWDVSDEDDEDD